MATTKTKKQTGMSLDRSDYLLVRLEAARRKMSINKLTAEWVEPELKKLRKKKNDSD